jgi:CelD/BcsL family acetyltransferase involved in cellulose biosynthesis
VKHDQVTITAPGLTWPEQGARAPSLAMERFARGNLLADAWARLERGASLPTQGLAFAAALSRTLLAGTRVEVFVGRGAGGIRGLIPLCRGAGRWARWRLAGAAEVFEPGDALCDGAEGARALSIVLARQGRPLVFDRVPVGSPLVPALRRALRGRALVSLRPAMPSPFVTLGPRWHSPEACFNAGRRSDFRRAARRAATMGPVFHEVIAPDLSEFDALFDEAIAVEASGWKCERGSAMARQPDKEAFFRDWLREACAQGELRIAFLRIGARAVAMQLALVQANRFWLLKIGYDETYRACSPGSLLMLHTLGHAAREGLAAYEMLGGMEPWIAQLWTQENHDCLRLRTYPFNLRGAVALAGDGWAWLRERWRPRARA